MDAPELEGISTHLVEERNGELGSGVEVGRANIFLELLLTGKLAATKRLIRASKSCAVQF